MDPAVCDGRPAKLAGYTVACLRINTPGDRLPDRTWVGMQIEAANNRRFNLTVKALDNKVSNSKAYLDMTLQAASD
jgi:hypothetical protein